MLYLLFCALTFLITTTIAGEWLTVQYSMTYNGQMILNGGTSNIHQVLMIHFVHSLSILTMKHRFSVGNSALTN